MNKTKSVGFQSTLIVNKYIIAGSFILSILAWWFKLDLIAIILLIVSAVGLISYLWGSLSLNKIEVTAEADSSVLAVGRSTEFRYHIENNKFLPLVWFEICQDVPVYDCMVPDENMPLKIFSDEEAAYSGRKKAYMRKFAFLMGHSELSFCCTWTGSRRGVYRPGDLILRSGDGFGLTAMIGKSDALNGKIFVIWPRIIPVNCSVFLKNVWSGKTGRNGWSEDISVLRDEREYQNGDSWKRIDWRCAARSGELYTKQYEMIRPQSFLFVIDTFSIRDKEEALSMAASVIWKMSEQGIPAGIALPGTDLKEPVILRPDDPSVSRDDCLFELADHHAEGASENGFDTNGILTASETAGQIWIIGESRKSISSSLLYRSLLFAAPRILSSENDGEGTCFDSVRVKEA